MALSAITKFSCRSFAVKPHKSAVPSSALTVGPTKGLRRPDRLDRRHHPLPHLTAQRQTSHR
jgi:hypothetical protein